MVVLKKNREFQDAMTVRKVQIYWLLEGNIAPYFLNRRKVMAQKSVKLWVKN
jgi:hypothetical protein